MLFRSGGAAVLVIGPILALIFSALSLPGLTGFKDEKNDYSEWLIFDVLQIAVASIALIGGMAAIIIAIFKESKTIPFAIFAALFVLTALETIPAVVLMILGGVSNDFGKDYSLKTIEHMEADLRCCFSLNDLARPNCKCHLRVDNDTDTYGNPGYDISYLYDDNNTLLLGETAQAKGFSLFGHDKPQPKQRGKKVCGECKGDFFMSQWWFIAISLAANFLTIILWGALGGFIVWVFISDKNKINSNEGEVQAAEEAEVPMQNPQTQETNNVPKEGDTAM